MPSLIDLRRRIRAVKSTQQITKAMKMIAASRLRRAQDRVVNARPFAVDMLRVLNDIAMRVEHEAHPLLDERPAGGKILLIVITADRGLCGSFNSNVIKNAGQFVVGEGQATVRGEGTEVALGLVGRKGRDFFARRGFEVRFEHVNIFQRLNYGDAQAIARAAIEDFSSRAVDQVYLVYNEFKSVLSQRVVIERTLPIPRLEEAPETEAAVAQVDYLYEPGADAIFTDLLPRHVEVQVWRALLESNAAFFAAQMMAMDTATKNSADMIDQLTLYMNKLRQAAITREIIEVVSGAQAQ